MVMERPIHEDETRTQRRQPMSKFQLLTPLRTWDDPDDNTYKEPVFANVLDEVAVEKQLAREKAIKEDFLEAKKNPPESVKTI